MEINPGVLAHSLEYDDSLECQRLTVSSRAPRNRPVGWMGGLYKYTYVVARESEREREESSPSLVQMHTQTIHRPVKGGEKRGTINELYRHRRLPRAYRIS